MNSDEIRELFEGYYRDSLGKTSDEVELAFSDLQPTASREEILLLFDLFYEAVTEGEKYTDIIPTSEVAQIESSELERELELYNLRVEQPLFSLKRRGSAPKLKRVENASSDSIAQVETLGIFRRFFSALVDLGAIVSAALVLTFIFGGNSSECQAGSFAGLIACNGRNVIFALTLFPVIALIYHLLCLVLFGSSGGLIVTGGALVDENGRIPLPRSRIVFSALWPISIVFFGWLPLLFGRKTLHEAVSLARLVPL